MADTDAIAGERYNETVVRCCTVATVFWGVVGFLVGLYLALELAFPVLNFDLSWLSFGRLRPVHTSAVIFAFGGNALLRHLVLCGAADLPGAAVRRPGRWPMFIFVGLPDRHLSWRPCGYVTGRTPRARSTPSPNGTWTLWLTRGLGALPRGLRRAP